MALWKVDEKHRKHSNGLCVHQAPDPEFWVKANANKV